MEKAGLAAVKQAVKEIVEDDFGVQAEKTTLQAEGPN